MAELVITNTAQSQIDALHTNSSLNLLEKLNIDNKLYQIHDPALDTLASTFDTTVATLVTYINGKQDTLTFDNAPTENSTNAISSGAVYTGLSAKADTEDLKTVAFTGSFNDLTDKPAAADLTPYAELSYVASYYRTLDDSYSKDEINGLINGIDQFKYMSVGALPVTPPTEDNMYCVYLVPNQGSGQNVKDEYIALWDGTSYSWELIGTTEVSLDGYVTQEVLSAQSYVTTDGLATELSSYATLSYVQTYVDAKQDALTFDDAPTENSTNVISSGVAYTYLNQKADKSEINELATAAVKTINGVAPTSGNLELATYSYETMMHYVGTSFDDNTHAYTMNFTTTTVLVANGVTSAAHA